MLPGVALKEAEETMKSLEKGQVCAIALVGNRYAYDTYMIILT